MIVVEQAIGLNAVPVPQGEVARRDVLDVVNNIVGVCDAVIHPQALRRAIRDAYLNRNARPGRPVAERFDLLVFDEDGVRAQPVETANRSVDQLRVANFAEIGLGVGQHRSFLPTLGLILEHAHKGIFCGHIIGKGIRLKRPRVPFAPKAVHERVHILHVGMPVVGIRQ